MSQVLKWIAAVAAIALLPSLAQVQISDNVVKLGVLTCGRPSPPIPPAV